MDLKDVITQIAVVKSENARKGYYIFEVMHCNLPSEYAVHDSSPLDNAMIKVTCTELGKDSGWVEIENSYSTISSFAESIINSYL